MQYWINHNGVQSGPVDIDGLKEMALTSRAYVWHEGLTDWVKITAVPELQGLYEMMPEDAMVKEPAPEPIPAPVEAQEEVATGAPLQNERPNPGAVTGQPYQQPSAMPGRPYQQPYQQPYQAAQQPAEAPVQTKPKCPPTNLVWAILSTLLCCFPAGVVSIIYSVKVMNKYNAGDIEGAERASETGAWWCIASIVLGIASMPLAYMIPLLFQ